MQKYLFPLDAASEQGVLQMLSDMCFSDVSTDNAEQLLALRNQCNSSQWKLVTLLNSIEPPYFAKLLHNGPNVTGYYIGMLVAGEATLMDIGVDAECRGKGLGELCLNAFIEHCERLEAESIWLEVRESNLVAQHLYQKRGFTVIDVRKNYYPTEKGKENAIVMKKAMEPEMRGQS